MKKLIPLVVLLFLLAGCKGKPPPYNNNAELIIYYPAKADTVEIVIQDRPRLGIHHYVFINEKWYAGFFNQGPYGYEAVRADGIRIEWSSTIPHKILRKWHTP